MFSHSQSLLFHVELIMEKKASLSERAVRIKSCVAPLPCPYRGTGPV